MSNDNPFFDNPDTDIDSTVIRPTPGGMRPQSPPPPTGKPAAPDIPVTPGNYSVEQGLNPLVASASPLLSLIAKLYNSASHSNVDGLRQQVEQELKRFESSALEHSDRETIHAARYCLCCVIDETVLNTPWGSQSRWSERSLLVSFHQETWGGEKFFVILERLMKDPARHLDMLELLYICLSMGFEGKFRVLDTGQRALEQAKETLFQLIKKQRGAAEPELSPHWRGEAAASHKIRDYIPVWVIALVTGALLLIIYFAFSILINQASSPAFSNLASIGREEPPAVIIEAAEPPPVIESNLYERVSTFLADEIAQDILEVLDADTDVIIRLRNKGLFGSGSATVTQAFVPILQRIADALSLAEGQIIIAGHSDNVPIRTLKFPSNWHLSKARADSVTQVITEASIIPKAITAEGRADSEPLVSNDSAANRALNRRVEIILEK
ncbi:type IVB secretion system protein IcmH/DotU [Vibrio sp. JC009]|uniref:type IVB secretion system protein IcmH/DotU n=1 Tax=Vibrio sp. JC009 TaxID=2912314 RepID=UPI0023AF2DF3|nr:type IVB secretion system protein IcmH/DotU [Vibrio sp. JC009]WED22939.1 type IVB secretion system protein IcmH/DotU [Vibrio sp. JC009]